MNWACGCQNFAITTRHPCERWKSSLRGETADVLQRSECTFPLFVSCLWKTSPVSCVLRCISALVIWTSCWRALPVRSPLPPAIASCASASFADEMHLFVLYVRSCLFVKLLLWKSEQNESNLMEITIVLSCEGCSLQTVCLIIIVT